MISLSTLNSNNKLFLIEGLWRTYILLMVVRSSFWGLIACLAFCIWIKTFKSYITYTPPQTCDVDLVKNESVCNLLCPNRTFALPGMLRCRPWLGCDVQLTLITTLSISVVKSVYLVKWENHEVVLSVLSSKKYEADFLQNLFMLKALTGNNHTVPLIGYCKNNIITKYYPLGNAFNLHYHLESSLKAYDSVSLRFNLCINYVSVINSLHSSPIGRRVMCDSNSLEKTLSQFLLTDDLRIVANDLDATPEVKPSEKGIICGHLPLLGSFVAPEQLWLFEREPYDVNKMQPYDEKTDIWKIPDVCNWILGDSSEADILKYKLFNINKQCKNYEASKRPSADALLKEYKKIFDALS